MSSPRSDGWHESSCGQNRRLLKTALVSLSVIWDAPSAETVLVLGGPLRMTSLTELLEEESYVGLTRGYYEIDSKIANRSS